MLSINPFIKMLESFFRYLWIFSKKKKVIFRVTYYFKDSIIYK